MNRKIHLSLPIAGILAGAFLLTGCDDNGCQMNKPLIDDAANQILTILEKNINKGNASKTLRNTPGMKVLNFGECTIPASTPECKSIKEEAITFNLNNNAIAARVKWNSPESKPSDFDLIVANKSTICTYPVFKQGKLFPGYRNGNCIQSPACAK